MLREREDPCPGFADVTGEEGQIDQRLDRLGAPRLDTGGEENGGGASAAVGDGGLFDELRRDAAGVGGPQHVVCVDGLQEGLNIPAVRLEEARVQQPPVHDHLGHRAVECGVAPWTHLEEAIGMFGEPLAAGVDDDELGPLELGPHDPAADSGELQSQVHAVDDDGLARVQLADRVCAGRDAQHVQENVDAVVAIGAQCRGPRCSCR